LVIAFFRRPRVVAVFTPVDHTVTTMCRAAIAAASVGFNIGVGLGIVAAFVETDDAVAAARAAGNAVTIGAGFTGTIVATLGVAARRKGRATIHSRGTFVDVTAATIAYGIALIPSNAFAGKSSGLIDA